ncbi:MAG: hypothetical protein K2O02_05040 [Lachnospiraceae bacterium]|nr:hypothetical protein [Lachnospiraceae bacterium]
MFFSYGRPDTEIYDVIRPGVTYLRAFCFGGWEKLKEVYRMISSFAEENHLNLFGYIYIFYVRDSPGDR